MKSFEFNKLFILQSLSPEDMVNGYAEPNTKLMETIDSVKKHNCKLSYFNYELITINGGKSQFEIFLVMVNRTKGFLFGMIRRKMMTALYGKNYSIN